ncbi:hypothetical protein CPHO_07175 [Corynebacterium phocae]|uniref:Uncharacterized protein n=1 Tax=Corynebacterium phocae TaxID=161895 RepID=A0A1L7D3Q6_9CORY|nr:hypothetical protein [Corynebacterium phocae]APT92707.1 hypothetical protein CPHO_07175 [Corynebacterium phocae]KAA8723012.1 hypothetical protein F4V58_06680 [Corynebacterium phocae]
MSRFATATRPEWLTPWHRELIRRLDELVQHRHLNYTLSQPVRVAEFYWAASYDHVRMWAYKDGHARIGINYYSLCDVEAVITPEHDIDVLMEFLGDHLGVLESRRNSGADENDY